MYLAGEWVNAWLFMSITFLVVVTAVCVLGWYVLHEDGKNRAGEEALDEKPTHGSKTEH